MSISGRAGAKAVLVEAGDRAVPFEVVAAKIRPPLRGQASSREQHSSTASAQARPRGPSRWSRPADTARRPCSRNGPTATDRSVRLGLARPPRQRPRRAPAPRRGRDQRDHAGRPAAPRRAGRPRRFDLDNRRCPGSPPSSLPPTTACSSSTTRTRSSEQDSSEVLAILAEHVPDGSALVLSSRVESALVTRLRSAAALLEIGAADLALTRREAELLLRNAGARLSDAAFADLIERTEGWAGALYLATLALSSRSRAGGARRATAVRTSGDDRYLADYFHSEYLAALSPRAAQVPAADLGAREDVRCALRRDARRERLVRRARGAQALEPLPRADRRGRHLVPLSPSLPRAPATRAVRDRARAREGARRPCCRLVRAARRCRVGARACAGGRRHGPRRADLRGDRAPDLLRRPSCDGGALARPVRSRSGSHCTRPSPSRRAGARAARGLGRKPSAGSSWPSDAECRRSGGCRAGRGHAGLVLPRRRRARCCRTPDRRSRPCRRRATGGAWRCSSTPSPTRCSATTSAPTSSSATRSRMPGVIGFSETQVIATGERMLLSEEAHDLAGSDKQADELSRLLAGGLLDASAPTAVAFAAAGASELRHGNWDNARAMLNHALKLTPFLTDAIPWLAVQTRLELARTFLALRDITLGQGSAGRDRRDLRLPSRSRRARGADGGAAAGARYAADARPRQGLEPHRRRDAADAVPADPSLVPGDRRPAAPLAQHDQDAGDLRLPQARRLDARRRDRRSSAARPRRRVRAGAGDRPVPS